MTEEQPTQHDTDRMTAREEFNTLYGHGVQPTKRPDGGLVPDFHVKLQSDKHPPSPSEGKSLTKEVELLRLQVADLCKAVRGLVQLQSVANQKLDAALKGGNAEVGVM